MNGPKAQSEYSLYFLSSKVYFTKILKKKKKRFFCTNLQQFRELNGLREHWSLEWTVDFPEQGKNLVN